MKGNYNLFITCKTLTKTDVFRKKFTFYINYRKSLIYTLHKLKKVGKYK